MLKNPKLKSVQQHDFAMIPRADIPRSQFRMPTGRKFTMSAGFLIPFLVEEVLPGDTWRCNNTTVLRTPPEITPVMDNWHFDVFYFYTPCRILWVNWTKMHGEQVNPGDSTSYTVPQVVSPVGGFAQLDIADYFGLPTAGQTGAGATISVNALPFRAYNKIFNQWFRDENLDNSLVENTGDGPDVSTQYAIIRRRKRPDYFTTCLPFVQKGTAVAIPITGNATVKTNATALLTGAQPILKVGKITDGTDPGSFTLGNSAGNGVFATTTATGSTTVGIYPTNLYADLSTATAATINALRLSFQTQKILERDARGGTRYTELLMAHFGVRPPDYRVQRPEYIGGGNINIVNDAIPQTSATGLTGATTPIGTLAATGRAAGNSSFSYSATEHGFIMGLCQVRADNSYQQGIRRMWSRLTRFDHYYPAFASLGEQAVLNKEIYSDGSANDANTFGYQERWGEYRYNPTQIMGMFRSTNSTPIDYWHSAQKFTTLPTLSSTFMQDASDVTLQRNFAGGAQTAGQQFLVDMYLDIRVARPMPMFSVPGNIDRF